MIDWNAFEEAHEGTHSGRIPWGGETVSELEPLLSREWLVTNGLGGYACGTVAGVVTRRYHGLLIAALRAPFGRMLMLPHLSEQIRLPDGRNVRFGGEERTGDLVTVRRMPLSCIEFRLELGLPVWRYEVDGIVLEKAGALAAPAEHRPRELSAGGGAGTSAAEAPAHRSISAPHDAPVSTPLPERVPIQRPREIATNCRPGRTCRACG